MSALAPPFSRISSNTPLKPFDFKAAALKSMPSFSATSEACFVGFCIEAITCRSPAKVDSTGTPVAVTAEIAAFNSSILTPAPAAIGAIRPICCAYWSTTILPSACVCANPSTIFPALSASNP